MGAYWGACILTPLEPLIRAHDMALHKLHPKTITTAAPGKYEDGGGLRLTVTQNGVRKWSLRFTLHGKRREIGLHTYPTTSLTEARDLAIEYRKLIRDGVDPIEDRKQKALAARQTGVTFKKCALDFIETQRSTWKNAKHADQWVSTLALYAFPVIEEVPVKAVTVEHILEILRPIWTGKTETAKRTQNRIEKVLDYAAALGLRDPYNPARWRNHLNKLLPLPSKIRKAEHFPAMPYSEVPTFFAEMEPKTGFAADALRMLLLTATRTNEVLKATWDEIDPEGRVWTVPGERMKAGREHRIPLPNQAIALLEKLPRVADSNFIFPGVKYGRPLSNMALLAIMRGFGYGPNEKRGNYVPHGFRSSFRDWAGEETAYPRDVCELALAHSIAGKTEAAYWRSDLLAKRASLMQEWADFVFGRTRESTQIQI
jgi:integrase